MSLLTSGTRRIPILDPRVCGFTDRRSEAGCAIRFSRLDNSAVRTYTIQMNTGEPYTTALTSLTAQQQRVLTFVSEFLGDQGFPPTLREIGEAIGLANINAVRGHVLALEKKGYITRAPEKARSIQVVHAPSTLSRAKRKLHEVLGTDEGVIHRVMYGLAWTTWQRTPVLTSSWAIRLRDSFEREAVEHGWTLVDTKIEPDHVVVVVRVWPNHSAQLTANRLRSAGNSLRHRHPEDFPGHRLWGKGYVVTSDLELLDELVVQLLNAQLQRGRG